MTDEQTIEQGWRLRKLADKTSEQRNKVYDPETGEKKLVNPATPGDDHEAWPLAGVEFVGEPPARATVSTKVVLAGWDEGWIELENSRPEHRPGGPAGARQWKVTHTFIHADTIVVKTVHGDVRYTVVHQPDKYVVVDRVEHRKYTEEVIDPDAPVTLEVYEAGDTRVDNFYKLELEA